MSMYSYKGGYPEPLPFRIILSNGFTRTDPTTFTKEELSDAGYTGPYVPPMYNSETHFLDWVDSKFVLKPIQATSLIQDWEGFRLEIISKMAISLDQYFISDLARSSLIGLCKKYNLPNELVLVLQAIPNNSNFFIKRPL